MKMHTWGVKDRQKCWAQTCIVCGATRFGGPHGWGRAMKGGKSVKYCEGKEKEESNERTL